MQWSDRGSVVHAVRLGSAGAAAGLEPGDIILSAKSGGFLREPDQPYSGSAYWERKEENKIVSLTPRRTRLSDWITIPTLRPVLVKLLVMLLDLFLAALIVFRRPYDPAARWGALYLAEVAIYQIYYSLYVAKDACLLWRKAAF